MSGKEEGGCLFVHGYVFICWYLRVDGCKLCVYFHIHTCACMFQCMAMQSIYICVIGRNIFRKRADGKLKKREE